LRADNTQLHARNLQLSQQANEALALGAENAHLRALLQLSQRIAAQATPAEIQYDTRDPFTQKVVIGRGAQQGIRNGSPVVTEDGVIGQVTRVFPLQAEVTLLTDKDQAVPVEILRTGLRSVIYGTPKGDSLDLRFVPISADVQTGDELVTSGLDGVYPPGLPVAKVVRVDKQADTAFARVVCLPVAAVRGARQMLVLHVVNDVPPRPADEPDAATVAKEAKKKARSADAKGAADKSAAKPGEKAAEKPADKAGEKATDKATDKAAGKASADKPAAGKAAEKAPARAAEKKSAAEKKPAKPADKPAATENAKPQAAPGAQQ
jgi:rod shape-determining protein MreC